MKLKHTNWLLRYAYLLGDDDVPGSWYEWNPATRQHDIRRPGTVSLCQLFWRTVGTTLVGLALTTLVVGLLVLLGEAIWLHKKGFAWLVTAAIAVAGTVYLCIKYSDAAEDAVDKLVESTPVQLGVLAYQGIKKHFCPIIEVD